MTAKFSIGDKVRINHRTPQFIREELKRRRTRTIANMGYDPDKQCSFYELGGRADYFFRSYMLTPVKRRQTTKRGQPQKRRKYRRN